MKTFITAFCTMISLGLAAQTVTLSFPGAAKNAKTYQVVIDGTSYSSAGSTANGRTAATTINTLSEGAHSLEVYAVNRNGRNTGTPAYAKTFQLRSGYDMNIAVRGNGQVSFTEKRSQGVTTTGTGAGSTAYTQLEQNVGSKRYQSDRINLLRSAFTTGSFTSAQVRQLLTYISSESQRLELAKLSYGRVTDKANFTTVYDVLSSDAARETLDGYVVSQGGSYQSSQSYPAYGTAMSETNFTSLWNKVRSYSYQTDRINTVRTALENSSFYFNTAQVRRLLTLVNAESERLTLVKQAYSRVTDPGSFPQLIDLFYTQASRTDFNNFVVSNGGASVNGTTYLSPMSDAAFQQLYNTARGHFFQKNTVADIQAAFNTASNYFSTDQVSTLLQLVATESARLSLAKLGYDRVVDPLNYSRVVDLFTVAANRTDLENYLQSKPR